MKIAINCRSFLQKNYTGIGRYAHSLVKSLSEIDCENKYLLYAQKGLFNSKRILPDIDKHNFSIKRDIFSRGVDKTVGKVDVYHSPSPDIVNVAGAKVVVTLHDLVYKAFPQGHTEETLKLTDEQCKSFIPQASKIICPSKNTLNDLHRFFDVPKHKSCVIPQGVDDAVFYKMNSKELLFASGVLKEKGVSDKFILSVGTIEPRKNLKGVFEAFSILKTKGLFLGKLLVVGMKGWKTSSILEHIDRLGISNDVIFLGFVSNDELRYLYNLAEVFVFPSYYEGFGYPLVEAFSCGAAVVSSNAASCKEISEGAAILIDPDDHETIAMSIADVLKNVELKERLQNDALSRAKQYSYVKTAEETLKIYREVCP